MFANIVRPPKLANILPCYIFLKQIIDGNCMIGHSLAKLVNIPQDKKVGKHTPPPHRWGAYILILIYMYLYIYIYVYI